MTRKLCIMVLLAMDMGCPDAYADSSLEFRASAFFPSSSRFRNVYADALPMFQVEANTRWLPEWGSWVSVDWLSDQGRSTGCSRTHTTLQMAALSLGVKNIYQTTERLAVYWGVGAAFSEVYVNNKSEGSSNAFTFGAVGKCGFNIALRESLFLDLFVDYRYYAPVFDTHVNVGGLQLGAGIGHNF